MRRGSDNSVRCEVVHEGGSYVGGLNLRNPLSTVGGGTVRGWKYRDIGTGQPRGCPARTAIEWA